MDADGSRTPQGSPSRCVVICLTLGLLDENTFSVSQRALARPRSSIGIAGAGDRANASDHYSEWLVGWVVHTQRSIAPGPFSSSRKCLAFCRSNLALEQSLRAKGARSSLASIHGLCFCFANVVVFQMTCLNVDSPPPPPLVLRLPLAGEASGLPPTRMVS
ncbi:hypothetical protein CSAL01_02251 [Colletotrichum salicis]|uniref:Uncharacterized protein n=1 Tax=Colletotrichum salicis TaxID=1209931 RepID=A0A135UBR5_9PEZI|nr:hypothetical protein CSAL01_02251 [Colletotrichum salicis]